MPIYEYACPTCRTYLQFWSQKMGEQKSPACPKCGGINLEKKISSFAIGKGNQQQTEDFDMSIDEDESGMPNPFENMTPSQQECAEREVMNLMNQAGSLDESDPKQMGTFMRKLTEASGVDFGPEMNEAIRRIEKGEDPEKVEDDLQGYFGDITGGSSGTSGGASQQAWSQDDTLYDM